jgi:ParB-like chromosome segregation protein Spo0J
MGSEFSKGPDESGLRELAASLKEHGLIQPITVRSGNDGKQGFLAKTSRNVI